MVSLKFFISILTTVNLKIKKCYTERFQFQKWHVDCGAGRHDPCFVSLYMYMVFALMFQIIIIICLDVIPIKCAKVTITRTISGIVSITVKKVITGSSQNLSTILWRHFNVRVKYVRYIYHYVPNTDHHTFTWIENWHGSCKPCSICTCNNIFSNIFSHTE